MIKGLKLRHLEAVIALAEEMHYGRAAERVGLSQSGLSRCIKSAEREANSKLFERDRRSIEITDAGRSYVEHTRISLAHGERAIRSARDEGQGRAFSGDRKVTGCGPSPGRGSLLHQVAPVL